MMRAKLLFLVGIIAFLLFLIVRLPIDTALTLSGVNNQISYARIEGDLSHLVLQDVSVGAFSMRKVELVPAWGALLLGGNEGHVEFEGRKGLFGEFNYSGSEIFTLDNVSLQSEISFPLGNIPGRGLIVLEGGGVDVNKQGHCVAGALDIRTNIMAELIKLLELEGPVLAGTVSCTAGTYVVALEGGTDDMSITGSGIASVSGHLPLEVSVQFKIVDSAVESMQKLLALSGFSEVDGRWRGTVNLELFQ